MICATRFGMLVKSPAFTAVAVLTLALGIGANTAIFSVVEGTLLRPLPFPHAERLVRLYEAEAESGARGSTLSLSEQTLRQWREFGGEIFEGIAAATETNVVLGSANGQPARNIVATRISANFLSVLGLPPARGRNFTAEEDREGGPAVVILSDDFWRNNLAARADVIGSSVTLDGVAAHRGWGDAEIVSSSLSRRCLGAARAARAIADRRVESLSLHTGAAACRTLDRTSGRSGPPHVCGHQPGESEPDECPRRVYAAVARQFRAGHSAEDSGHRRRCAQRLADRGGQLRRFAPLARDRAGR